MRVGQAVLNVVFWQLGLQEEERIAETLLKLHNRISFS